MLEKFKMFFNALSKEDKRQAVDYILQSQDLRSLNEGLFTGPSNTIEKGLFSGPINSNGKCKVCGK